MKFQVIVVDDDKVSVLINRKIILMSHFHAEPLSFLDGRETLEYLLKINEKDTTYCILLDINMPFMNGWQFLDAITNHTLGVQIFVVMVTSSVDLADKEKAKTYPIVIGFLEKPINLKTMQELKTHDNLRVFFD